MQPGQASQVTHLLFLSFSWFVALPASAAAVTARSRWSYLWFPLGCLTYILSICCILSNDSVRWTSMTPAISIAVAGFFAHGIAAFRIRLNQSSDSWLKCHPIPRFLSFSLWFLPPLAGLAHLLLSVAALFPLCDDIATKQCIAHWSIGYTYISYGTLSFLTFRLSSQNLTNAADSWFFFITGLMNIFGEHWSETWTHEDMQHTSMGFILASAGILGLIQSRCASFTPLDQSKSGSIYRRIAPTVVSRISLCFPIGCIAVGWAMSAHSQGNMFATHVHNIVGILIMFTGVLRFLESVFQLSSIPRVSEAWALRQASSLSVLVAGTLFIGATDREIALLQSINIEPISYILTLSSVAVLWFAAVTLYHGLMHFDVSSSSDIEFDPIKSIDDDSCSTLLESPV